MSDDRYQIITWRGYRFDRWTIAAIEKAEADLGISLAFRQGSYNAGGVAASGGTHDGGGAVDIDITGLSLTTINRIVDALRRAGFAAWYRPELWQNGVRIWGPHIHAVQAFNAKLSPAAAAQIGAYARDLDGLADGAKDTHAFHPTLVGAPYPFEGDDMTPAQEAKIDALTKAVERLAKLIGGSVTKTPPSTPIITDLEWIKDRIGGSVDKTPPSPSLASELDDIKSAVSK